MPIATYDSDPPFDFLGVERPFLAVFSDLNALTPGQKTAVWNNFVLAVPAPGGGTAPRWSLDDGPNAKALAAASGLAIDMPVGGTWTAALQTTARLKMVTIYLFDRPKYLKNPAFDPTISVLPYTPAA